MSYHSEIHEYMNMPMNQWPESLQNTVKTVSNRIGFCMDVCAETVDAWLKAGKVELKYGGEDGFDLVPYQEPTPIPPKKKFRVDVTIKGYMEVEATSEYVARAKAATAVHLMTEENNDASMDNAELPNLHEFFTWDDTDFPFTEEIE